MSLPRANGHVVVFDGHDGAGKSSTAAVVGARLGLRVVKPFADTLGDHIAWLWGHGEYDAANTTALQAVQRVRADAGRNEVLLFDRHWATIFTVVPTHLWDSWRPLPPTIIFAASAQHVQQRLLDRGEPAGITAQHDYFDTRYRDLVNECPGAIVLDTGSLSREETIDTAMSTVARWVEAIAAI